MFLLEEAYLRMHELSESVSVSQQRPYGDMRPAQAIKVQ